jgi:flagellar biogenesis protein FliO
MNLLQKYLFLEFMLICNAASAAPELDLKHNKLPYKTISVDISDLIQKILLSLILISLLAYLVTFLIKKYYNKNIFSAAAGQEIKLIAMRRVSRNLSVITIRIENMKYSIAQSQNGLLLLDKETIVKDEQENDSNKKSAG